MAAMELDPARLASPAQDGAISVTPLAGTRAQAVQRLQVGLSGLAAMVLLVGLANIIIASAEQHRVEAEVEAVTLAPPAAPKPETPSNPLADAGVVPTMPAEQTPAPAVIEPVDPDLLRGDINPRP